MIEKKSKLFFSISQKDMEEIELFLHQRILELEEENVASKEKKSLLRKTPKICMVNSKKKIRKSIMIARI